MNAVQYLGHEGRAVYVSDEQLLAMRERAVYVSDEQTSGHEGKGSLC